MAFKRIPIAYSVPSAQSNMPLYVKPSVMTGWGSLTLAEAQSSRWYADEGMVTEIAREIVGADEIHHKMPTVPTSGGEVFTDYDGVRADYAVGATYGRNAVWGDYEFVLHGILSSGNLVDSAGNITTTKQTANTPTNPSGPVGDGFNPNSAYWTTNYVPFTEIGTGDFSFQYWADFSTGSARRSVILMGRNLAFEDVYYEQAYRTSDSPANKIVSTFREGPTGQVDVAPTDTINGTQRMYHLTRSGTNARKYSQGALGDNTTNAEVAASLGVSGNSVLTIASAYTTGVQPSGSVTFDEFRLRKSILSANWITTEYNNQSAVATFWGTVTDAGGAPVANNGFMVFF